MSRWVLLGTALAGCGSSSSGAETDGGSATSSEGGDTSSVATGASTQASSSSTGADPDAVPACREFQDITFPQWQRLVDPDHLTVASKMVALQDGGVAIGGSERILRFDADGTPSALHHAYGRVAGLAPAENSADFWALIETENSLRLVGFDAEGEQATASAPFEQGVVAYGMPLIAAEQPLVLTMVHGEEEGEGRLQVRGSDLAPQLELDVPWTLDTWATVLGEGQLVVGTLDADLTSVTITSYDGGEVLWSQPMPVEEPGDLRYPHALTSGDALFLHAATLPSPLRALDMTDGTLLWEDTLAVNVMAKTPCGDVVAIEPGDDYDRLHRLGADGTHQVTLLTRQNQPHSGAATVVGLEIGADGTLFVSRVLQVVGTSQTLSNIMSY